MKKILFIGLLTLFMSCENIYTTVVDVNDGKFMTVRDGQRYTNVGDTLIVMYETQGYRGVSLYGKYVKEMPKKTANITYRKVVRTK
jgi:hypothetical protein